MVIDTMVFAYAFLNVPEFRVESLAVLDASSEILVPESFRAEFVNTVWQWIRGGTFPLHAGVSALRDANTAVTEVTSVTILWERALQLAVEANHPAYDTLFIALAESANTKVVTYDARLRTAFPNLTLSPSEFLANPSDFLC